MAETDDMLPMSALQHLLYCERQCALIHVDGVWLENVHTAAGRVLHERVDSGEDERRGNLIVLRSVVLVSERLKLRGIADVVELRRRPDNSWNAYPVEYKRGPRRGKIHDDVQVCAQAMALEEMTGNPVLAGAIFHGKTKRRREVKIDDALREVTRSAALRLHAMIAAREVPPAHLDERCRNCSLNMACQPDRPPLSLAAWMNEVMR